MNDSVLLLAKNRARSQGGKNIKERQWKQQKLHVQRMQINDKGWSVTIDQKTRNGFAR